MLTFQDLLNVSQRANASRHLIAGSDASFGSELGTWGSRKAAIRAALVMMQECPNALCVTLQCPESELL